MTLDQLIEFLLMYDLKSGPQKHGNVYHYQYNVRCLFICITKSRNVYCYGGGVLEYAAGG